MPDNDFYTPTDMDALRMENELLNFEVRFLKARLSGGSTSPTSGDSTSPAEHTSPTSDARLVHLEAAEKDLVLILQKLSGSPLASALRTRKAFRDLEQKYLRSGRDGPGGSSLAHLEAAENDLIMILKKLSGSPLGPALRLAKKEFRNLEQRYL